MLNNKQLEVLHNVKIGKNVLITGDSGCHIKDTKIIMFDGTIKMVQDIKENDLLMGDDSTSRKVLKLVRGKEMMYKITNIKNESYIVNENHILCLIMTTKKKIQERTRRQSFIINWFDNKNIKFNCKTFSYKNKDKNEIYKLANEYLNNIEEELKIDISINDYLKLLPSIRSHLNGYKVPIAFKEIKLPLDPYMIGYWLGDDNTDINAITSKESTVIHYFKNNLQQYKCYLQFHRKYTYRINGDGTNNKFSNYFMKVLRDLNLLNNKHIPHIYKCNYKENQLKLLAGFIDANGYLSKNGGFEICQSLEHEQIIDDIIYLCRSLGLACYKNIKNTSWTYKGIKKYGETFRIHINGNGIKEIPTLSPRKKSNPRQQIKDLLVSRIYVEKLKIDNYYGFQLDGNHRYMMDNFIITHNCGKSFCIQYIIDWAQENDINIGVTASTGTAAFLIKGKTLHSFLGIGLGTLSAEKLAEKTIKKNEIVYTRLTKIQILIIDEISMIGIELFNKISNYLCIIRKNKKPFGGIQIILSGDFCQLPPINENYCFTSDIWKKANIQNIILEELIRHYNIYEYTISRY